MNNDNVNVDTNTTASTALLPSNESHRRRRRHRHHVKILLLVSISIGLASGTLYGFGRYSRALKEQLNLSQIQVQNLGIILDCGNYIGHPVTGYVYDHYGPRVSCVGAAIVVFWGYASVALAITISDTKNGSSSNDDSNDNMMMMMISLLCHFGFFCVGLGSGLGYIAGLGSVTKEFFGKATLGKAVAAVAAGYGLSSTLVGITFHQISSLRGFFWFWAVTVAVVNLVGAIIFTKEEEDGEERNMRAIQMMDNEITMSNESSSGSENGDDFNSQQQTQSDTEGPGAPVTLGTHSQRPSYRPWAFSTRLHSWQTWKLLDFWMLFGSFACVTGCGLFIINNISTMVQSLGQPDSLAGNLLFLLSICNVAGRLLMGAMADLPHFHKIGLFQGVALLMLLGFLISALSPLQEGNYSQSIPLTITVASVAIAYGGSWVLIVGILADSFGRENFGKDYGLIAMGPALSGLVFNSVSASMYETHAEANGNEDGVCYGTNCYQGSYWMATGAALIGSLILYQMPRTRATGS